MRGAGIEEELRERCRNSTVVITPTGPFCAELVNASVKFNVQERVSKGEEWEGHVVGVEMVKDESWLLVVTNEPSLQDTSCLSVCLSVSSLMSPLRSLWKWSSVILAMPTMRGLARVCAVLTKCLSSTAVTIQTDTSMCS